MRNGKVSWLFIADEGKERGISGVNPLELINATTTFMDYAKQIILCHIEFDLFLMEYSESEIVEVEKESGIQI